MSPKIVAHKRYVRVSCTMIVRLEVRKLKCFWKVREHCKKEKLFVVEFLKPYMIVGTYSTYPDVKLKM